ncbi:MAG: hypothetical protein OIF47_09220 [Marinibacterium sp.]|nr:hypothetical protein [Marinibacterium sp.]
MACCRAPVSGCDPIDAAALSGFGPVRLIRPLRGGNRNSVFEAQMGRERCVAKRTRRTGPELRWISDLMAHAARCGFVVAPLRMTASGALSSDGWTLEPFLPGHAHRPDPAQLRPRLAALHDASAAMGQRPGWVGLGDLAKGRSGGDVDLRALPPSVAQRCQRAWQAVATAPRAAIHGDLGAGNLRCGPDGALQLIDWDEARLDARFLDHAGWDRVTPDQHHAHLAWEIACGWTREPDHARACLTALTRLTG